MTALGDSPVLSLALGLLAGGAIALWVWLASRRRARRTEAAFRAAVASFLGTGSDAPPVDLERLDRSIVDALTAASDRLLKTQAWAGNERDVVLSKVGDGVMLVDSHGVVQFVNLAQSERLGLPHDRILGRRLIELLPDYEVYEAVRRCLATDREERLAVETRPGKRLLNVSVAPVGGRRCAIVLQDRTELRRLERVRREFVANMSHELRTPLATLKLLSETLSLDGGGDPEVTHDYLGRIEVEVDRLAQMVDELGELSLIETGQVALERTAVPVSVLAHRAVERLDAQAARAGATVIVDIPDGLPDVYGDERRLERVLVNLLHNAIKFTPPGGSIGVSGVEDDGVVVVSVHDTGPGIAADDLERIFERFYKVDKSRSGVGTGLGLAIARHTVELHGGRIWATSVEGQGSTFSFTLPVVVA